MVGSRRASLSASRRPTFFAAETFSAGTTCVLDEAAARHVRVLRLEAGAVVGLRDGAGRVGDGQLVRISKTQVYVEVSSVAEIDPLPPVHLLVPVADKDRMLLLAEKVAELGCTSWRPVLWRRSRSVSPRGEGMSFQAKVRSRMEQALMQSEGAWLPQLYPEANLERALLAAPAGERFILEPGGATLLEHGQHHRTDVPVTIAIGPEGGIEDDELEQAVAAGFRPASLGDNILRFETATIVALGVARMLVGTATGGRPE